LVARSRHRPARSPSRRERRGARRLGELHEVDRRGGEKLDADAAFKTVVSSIGSWTPENLKWVADDIVARGASDASKEWALDSLTKVNDLRFPCGSIKRSAVLEIVRAAIWKLLASPR